MLLNGLTAKTPLRAQRKVKKCAMHIKQRQKQWNKFDNSELVGHILQSIHQSRCIKPWCVSGIVFKYTLVPCTIDESITRLFYHLYCIPTLDEKDINAL